MGGDDASENPLTKLSPLESVGLGVAAGTIEVCCLQPMLYCKNATQQGLPFTLNPAILYRGLTMSIMNMSILTGVQFPHPNVCVVKDYPPFRLAGFLIFLEKEIPRVHVALRGHEAPDLRVQGEEPKCKSQGEESNCIPRS